MEANEIDVNIAAAQEHVPEIERMVRTVKERYRAMYHRAPYNMWTKLMIIRGAGDVVKWLNTFPPSGEISPTYSPRCIITRKPVDFDKHCTVSFGSYVQATTQNTPTNTMEERSIDGIYLQTLDNTQAGHEVLNLKTGKVITRHKVKEIPLTKQVIERVEQLAKRDGFKPHAEPIFRTYALFAGVDNPITNENETINEEDTDEEYELEDEDDESYNAKIEQQELDELENEGALTPGVDITDNLDEQTIATTDTPIDDEPIPNSPRRSTRTPVPREMLKPTFHGQTYEAVNHLVTQVNPPNTIAYEEHELPVLAKAFAQTYTLSQGIKRFGEKGKQAAITEMKQLHDRSCFRPIKVNDLTDKQRRAAMNSLIFLTEKRDGRIKGRTCADGSKQRTWMSKEDASSPTVALESVMLSAVIDAKEGRDVAVVDIPNAFVQTENVKIEDHHERDIMKVKGALADMLVEIDPEFYGPYLTKENGVSVLYLEILKALYGMLKSALLFYRKLRKDLESIGFKFNPYDRCVANKTINGKQFTVMSHVDDLKCSHKDTKEVDKFIQWCRDKYEDPTITKLKPSRGKVHDYLGITLDFTKPGAVKIYMKDYIKKMLAEFKYLEEVEALKKVTTPAAEHLFMTNPNGIQLDERRKEEFHTTVAKALFLCKRARPDLQPTVPFLCTRVQSPDKDDWKKLLRMLKYQQDTAELELILEAGEGDVLSLHWYPDAAFAVHPDMKSHTGAILTLGKGAANTISSKQKLNTRSSTEAELVAADDIAPQAIWTTNFLEHQGYKSESIIFQDNLSTMQLEKNGMESSSKRTRHINIRYYFIKDCIDKNYFKVKYCPTDDMIGDYPSKPLQGRKFRKHRKSMMGN